MFNHNYLKKFPGIKNTDESDSATYENKQWCMQVYVQMHKIIKSKTI